MPDDSGAAHEMRAEREMRAMRRALLLAARGPERGANPRVGCVILDAGGHVIAEGWHRGAGTAHAEVDALARLDRERARGATAIVTLEPCNHHGRTGPCARALLDAGISRVVYAIGDPGEESSGGADTLRAGGVDVAAGVLADEAAAFLADWLAAARLGRPVVTVKWASSLDGRAAAADGTSRWITGDAARHDVHRRRSEADAIAVGTGTLLADDPALTARRPDGTLHEHQPVPVVFGRSPIPAGAAINAGPHEPIRLEGELAAGLRELHARGIRSLFVEGGPTLASSVIAAGLADEVLVYLAPVLLGGPRLALGDVGVPTISEALRLRIHTVERLGDDLLLVARPAGPASAEPAAPDPTQGGN